MEKKGHVKLKEEVLSVLRKAGFSEKSIKQDTMYIETFGLEESGQIGIQIVNLLESEESLLQLGILLPGQICPEHFVLSKGQRVLPYQFRCHFGKLYCYREGVPTYEIKAQLPEDKASFFTVFHEEVMEEGMIFSFLSEERHWMQAGEEGAVFFFLLPQKEEFEIFYTMKE